MRQVTIKKMLLLSRGSTTLKRGAHLLQQITGRFSENTLVSGSFFVPTEALGEGSDPEMGYF